MYQLTNRDSGYRVKLSSLTTHSDIWCASLVWPYCAWFDKNIDIHKYFVGETPVRINSLLSMMTSSNGDIFHVTRHLCREFTGHRWVPRTKASDAELWYFQIYLICGGTSGWINNRKAGDLRRHCAHYDVIEMEYQQFRACIRWCFIPHGKFIKLYRKMYRGNLRVQ